VFPLLSLPSGSLSSQQAARTRALRLQNIAGRIFDRGTSREEMLLTL